MTTGRYMQDTARIRPMRGGYEVWTVEQMRSRKRLVANYVKNLTIALHGGSEP
jgi:hypothetical protein